MGVLGAKEFLTVSELDADRLLGAVVYAGIILMGVVNLFGRDLRLLFALVPALILIIPIARNRFEMSVRGIPRSSLPNSPPTTIRTSTRPSN